MMMEHVNDNTQPSEIAASNDGESSTREGTASRGSFVSSLEQFVSSAMPQLSSPAFSRMTRMTSAIYPIGSKKKSSAESNPNTQSDKRSSGSLGCPNRDDSKSEAVGTKPSLVTTTITIPETPTTNTTTSMSTTTPSIESATTSKPKKSEWPPKGAKRWIPPETSVASSSATTTSSFASPSGAASAAAPRVSLLEIVAEQAENKRAAQVAIGDSSASLAALEREQERLFRNVEQQKTTGSQSISLEQNEVSLDGPSTHDDEELLEVLKQSLIEYERTKELEKNKHDNPQRSDMQKQASSTREGSERSFNSLGSSSTQGQSQVSGGTGQAARISSRPSPPRRITSLVDLRKGMSSPDDSITAGISLSEFPVQAKKVLNRGGAVSAPSSSPRRYQAMSLRDLTSGSMDIDATDNSSLSSLDHLPRSHSPTLFRTVGDQEFSRRTMQEIERTETVVDNPHSDARERRKRLIKSRAQSSRGLMTSVSASAEHRVGGESLRAGVASLPSKKSALAADRDGQQEAAQGHLTAQELLDITKALQEADGSDSQDLSRVLTQSSTPSPTFASFQSKIPVSSSGARRSSWSTFPPTDDEQNASYLARQRQSLKSLPSNLQQAFGQQPFQASLSVTPPSESGDGQAFLSEDEAVSIELALQEADAKLEEQSLMLAFQMQQEEINNMNNHRHLQQHPQRSQGNVRTMTRVELDNESQRVGNAYRSSSFVVGRSRGLTRHTSLDGQQQTGLIDAEVVRVGAVYTREPPARHPLEQQEEQQAHSKKPNMHATNELLRCRPAARQEDDHEEAVALSAGFRINSEQQQRQQQAWSRLDRNAIIGPNNEVRTKHDTVLQGQSNAERLALEADEHGVRAHVGNQAYNSFRKSMKRTTKGVASHGTGRAGSDADSTTEKAMDPQVRQRIANAINVGLIDKCNGAVKQGKEAIVYHADKGMGSEGYDVAVKVFKRIQEFRGRGEYVDGDPRYVGRPFHKADKREQLAMWTEKEYRNLVRANRAMVPVPTPLRYKDNVLFMRFLGTDGWPAPQLRDLEIRKGSKKWGALYGQVMEAIRRLYVHARLVHGDLSEYNILVSPKMQVQNKLSSSLDDKNEFSKHQPVLIDFGQAVDLRHPEAKELLRRDLTRIIDFFSKQGVDTHTIDDALEYVEDDFGFSGDDWDDDSFGENDDGGAEATTNESPEPPMP